ncbi:MAG TPA: hypothetical protein VN278_02925 [Methanosarcina sp.]|nr:hypothetical protein [Methanosarcina sp.]
MSEKRIEIYFFCNFFAKKLIKISMVPRTRKKKGVSNPSASAPGFEGEEKLLTEELLRGLSDISGLGSPGSRY